MSYESICERNRKLYAELEDLTRQINSSDIDFILKRQWLINRRQNVRDAIDRNLDLIFNNDMKPAGKLEDRPYYKRVQEFIKTHPDTPVPVIAGVCGIKAATVTNVIKFINQ